MPRPGRDEHEPIRPDRTPHAVEDRLALSLHEHEDLIHSVVDLVADLAARHGVDIAGVCAATCMTWSEIAEQTDGSLLVTLPAPDLNWAASTILAYGPVVEVLDPPELRQLVRDWAKAIANLNGNSMTHENVVTTSIVY